MPISFRFRLIPCVATVLIALSGLNLGLWQTHRAQEKQNIEYQMQLKMQEPALDWRADKPQSVPAYTKLRVSGEFIQDWPLYLDNRSMRGLSGRYVLMPFRTDGGTYVLIARGWVPRDPKNRLMLPSLSTPRGRVQLEGIVRDKPDRVMQLGQVDIPKPGAILQNLELSDLATQTGFSFSPFLLEQTSATEDGLIREWPLPSAGIEKHRAYAFQWYALSVMACLFFIFSGIRRGNRTEPTL
jgi:surfeit locus 1 family protein